MPSYAFSIVQYIPVTLLTMSLYITCQDGYPCSDSIALRAVLYSTPVVCTTVLGDTVRAVQYTVDEALRSDDQLYKFSADTTTVQYSTKFDLI